MILSACRACEEHSVAWSSSSTYVMSLPAGLQDLDVKSIWGREDLTKHYVTSKPIHTFPDQYSRGLVVEKLPKPLAEPLNNAKRRSGPAFVALWGAWAPEMGCTRAGCGLGLSGMCFNNKSCEWLRVLRTEVIQCNSLKVI